jgi:hypothetical protein
MRRFVVIILCALSFLVTIPAPAHAWWDWLDEYTGRGPFWGPDIQFRLLCVNDSLPEREPNTLEGRNKLEALKTARTTFDGAFVTALHELNIDMNLAMSHKLESFLVDLIPRGSANQDSSKLESDIKDVITNQLKLGLQQKGGGGSINNDTVDRVARALAQAGNQLAQAVANFKEEVEKIRRSSNPGDYVLRSLESFGSANGHSAWARAGATAAGVGCIIGGNRNPIASLNIRSRYLWSRDNDRAPDGHLDYSNGAVPSVRQWQNEVLFSMFADRAKSIELVTGVGVSHIYTPSGEFAAFNRFYWKPVELDFAPVPLVRSKVADKNPAWNNFLTRGFTLSGSILYMPKGFVAADFGATGDYKVDRELVGMFGISWDLSRF